MVYRKFNKNLLQWQEKIRMPIWREKFLLCPSWNVESSHSSSSCLKNIMLNMFFITCIYMQMVGDHCLPFNNFCRCMWCDKVGHLNYSNFHKSINFFVQRQSFINNLNFCIKQTEIGTTLYIDGTSKRKFIHFKHKKTPLKLN